MSLILSDQRNGLPFPSEITEQVFSYLTNPWRPTLDINQPYSDQETLKNARLTCRSFHYFASPLLFRRLVISPFLRQLETCFAVAGHPVYSQGVTELVYDSSISSFPGNHWTCWTSETPDSHTSSSFALCFKCVLSKRCLSLSEQSLFIPPQKVNESRFNVFIKRLHNAAAKYVPTKPKSEITPVCPCSVQHMKAQEDMDMANHLEQKVILQDGRDQFAMWNLFKSLPKLRKLSYGCRGERWFPFMFAEYNTFGAGVCPPLPQAPTIPPRSVNYAIGSYSGDLKEFLGFTSVTHALTMGPNPIKEFELRASLEILRMSNGDADTTCQAFRSLTDLSLTFIFGEPPCDPPGQVLTPRMLAHLWEVGSILDNGHTARMFGAVSELRSMTLHLCPVREKVYDFYEILYRVPFNCLIDETTWSSLQHVSFNGFDFTEAEIVQFFEKHADTLTVIELKNMTLSQGDWGNVVAVLLRMQKLHTFTIVHVQEYNSEDDYWMSWDGFRRRGGCDEPNPWRRSLRLEGRNSF